MGKALGGHRLGVGDNVGSSWERGRLARTVAACFLAGRERRPRSQGDPLPVTVIEWIRDAQELELMEIGIGSPDLGNSMLSHYRCDMKIMKPVAGHLRVFTCQIADDFPVPVGLRQDIKGRKGPQLFHGSPRPHSSTGWTGSDEERLQEVRHAVAVRGWQCSL